MLAIFSTPIGSRFQLNESHRPKTNVKAETHAAIDFYFQACRVVQQSLVGPACAFEQKPTVSAESSVL